ncbi:MAG: metalloregulator ArsR/SmtB family transcription factor [Acidobacteria bacterium]|nr:metalloregulator ArsR/SmtB family transcription factor [Acidobacteriota bacterium]
MSSCCTSSPAPRVRNAAALTGLYQALADATRLRILAILTQQTPDGPDGELCVCHIHDCLGVSQPTASRHLAYLRKAGLVEARRQGVWMHYRIVRPADPVVASVFDAAIHALDHAESTVNDRARLARVSSSAPTA